MAQSYTVRNSRDHNFRDFKCLTMASERTYFNSEECNLEFAIPQGRWLRIRQKRRLLHRATEHEVPQALRRRLLLPLRRPRVPVLPKLRRLAGLLEQLRDVLLCICTFLNFISMSPSFTLECFFFLLFYLHSLFALCFRLFLFAVRFSGTSLCHYSAVSVYRLFRPSRLYHLFHLFRLLYGCRIATISRLSLYIRATITRYVQGGCPFGIMFPWGKNDTRGLSMSP
jgi:hypothetical protein